LVGDLEGSDRKIADGDELKGVLDDIEDGGYGEFPAIWTENICTKVTKGHGPKVTDLKERRFPVACRRRRRIMVVVDMEVMLRVVWG